jgi:hypothetical protein
LSRSFDPLSSKAIYDSFALCSIAKTLKYPIIAVRGAGQGLQATGFGLRLVLKRIPSRNVALLPLLVKTLIFGLKAVSEEE